MFRQSFQQTIVSNIPAILASGNTTALAVEQVGIFDARTNQAVTLPSFSTTRELYIAQGTPDFSNFPAGAGKLNETVKSKYIKGNKITGWRGVSAQQGQTSQVAVGYNGIDPTTTLKAKPGDVLNFFIKLTGSPIEKLVPGVGGYVVPIQISMPCAAECPTDCETVDCNIIVDRFMAAFNKIKLPGGILLHKWVKASEIINCTTPPSPTLIAYDFYCLTICDAGDQHALGTVQAQYPGLVVTRTSRDGSLSTYQFSQPNADAAPADFTNEGLITIPNCTTCPAGYTLNTADIFSFTIGRTDTGDATALIAVKATYAATTDAPTMERLSYQGGYSIYQVYGASATTPLAVGNAGDTVALVGQVQSLCVLTGSPTTTAWSVCATGNKEVLDYTLTIKDSVCGTSWLTALQAIYGSGVTQIAYNATTCVRQYQLPVTSDNIDLTGDCEQDFFTFTMPASFNSVAWVQTPAAVGSGCSCGILLESGFVNRTLTECYFDAFPYEYDAIHIEVATGDPNYNDYQDLCDTDLPVTVLRNFTYPIGSGQYIAHFESLSREYDQLEGRPVDQFVRNARQWTFNTDLTKFYDQYVLEFEVEYFVGGFTEKYHDRYHLNVYFPQGQGAQFQTAINAYVSSSNINLPLVVL